MISLIPNPVAPIGPISPVSPRGISKVKGSTSSSVKYMVTRVDPFSPIVDSTRSIINPSSAPPNKEHEERVIDKKRNKEEIIRLNFILITF